MAMVPFVKLMGNKDGGKVPETFTQKIDESTAWKESPPEVPIAF